MSRAGSTAAPPDPKDEQVRVALNVMALALAQATSAFNRLAVAVGEDPAVLGRGVPPDHDGEHEQRPSDPPAVPGA